MSLCNCTAKCSCTLKALIASIIVGVLTTFLQITAVITLTPAFLWVAFGVSIGYLGILSAAAGFRSSGSGECLCTALTLTLIGILGTILLALVLLAVGIVATSLISAILVGLLLFFLALLLTGTACYVRCAADCETCT